MTPGRALDVGSGKSEPLAIRAPMREPVMPVTLDADCLVGVDDVHNSRRSGSWTANS